MEKLLRFLFTLCFIILLPIGEIIRIAFSNGVALTVFDGGLVLLLCLWLSQNWLGLVNQRLPFQKPILLFIAACFFSLIFNVFFLPFNEIFIASLYLFRWILYAGIYIIIATAKPALRKKIPLILLVSGAIVLLIGYGQFFFYPALRNLLYLGWDEHYYRMFGSFFDPNFLGAFLDLYLIFLIGICLKNDKKYCLNRITLLILSLATLIAIFLTFSRSAYIMCLVSLVVVFIMVEKKKLLFLVFGIILVIASCYFLFLKHPREGTNLFRTSSTLARIGSTEQAWKIFMDHPIFGIGFNTYRFVQREYGFLPKANWEESHAGAGTDNSWLFVLGTTGAVGFTAYIFMWWKILQLAWREKKKNIFQIILFSSAIGLFIDSFFINSLFYPFIMAWMWVMVAL